VNNKNNVARSREGEKFIPDCTDEPYQFDDDASLTSSLGLPNGEVIVRATHDELLDAMAAVVFTEASLCVSQYGDFQLALSNTPLLEPLYSRLMYDPNLRGIPWQNTHIWQLCHSGTSPTIVKETIGDHADIPSEQLHVAMPTQIEGEEAIRLDCFVVDKDTEIPENFQTRVVLMFAQSVATCKHFAKTCTNYQVKCFALQEKG